MKAKDEIVITTFLTYPGNNSYAQRRVFSRYSVFVLSQGEDQYVSVGAVSTQIVLVFLDFVLFGSLISQRRLKKVKMEENDENPNNDLDDV